EILHYAPGQQRGETWDLPLHPLLIQAQQHLVGVERLILTPNGERTSVTLEHPPRTCRMVYVYKPTPPPRNPASTQCASTLATKATYLHRSGSRRRQSYKRPPFCRRRSQGRRCAFRDNSTPG